MEGARFDDIIELNVGGVHFKTSRHTLLACSDSFFTAAIGETFKAPAGPIFIDRDPGRFTEILNWLRTGPRFMREITRLAFRS